MKQGFDYLVSKEKRRFDLAFCAASYPAYVAIDGLVGSYLAFDGRKLPVVIKALRAGLGGDEFEMYKFNTYEPGSRTPLNKWAGSVLRYGLNELPQVRNIKAGQMSAVGPRPLDPVDHKSYHDTVRKAGPPGLLESLIEVEGVAKPGIINSLTIAWHFNPDISTDYTPGNAIERAVSTIEDGYSASLAKDARLTAMLLNEVAVSVLQ